MMIDLDLIRHEMARASGVIATLYAIVRDYVMSQDTDKNCKLDDVVSDTITGLANAITECMNREGQEEDDGD